MRHLQVVLLSAALVALTGCPRGADRSGMPAAKAQEFLHKTHLALEFTPVGAANAQLLDCASCHSASESTKWIVQRPGAEHAPCDSCHADAFYQEPAVFCATCHASIDATKKGMSPLHDYPRRRREAQLISDFNHKVHLDGAKVNEGGQALMCKSCHTVEGGDSPYVSVPTHAECASCHAKDAEPLMADCASCHARDGHGMARHFLGNDVAFTHAKHQVDEAGQAIACIECHYAVVSSVAATDLDLPLMKDCATCHEDADKTPDSVRISECTVCHAVEVGGDDVPDNHTAYATPEDQLGRMLAAMTPSADDMPALMDAVVPMFSLPIGQALDAAASQPAAMAKEPMAKTRRARAFIGETTAQVQRRPEDHTPLFRLRHEDAAADTNAKCQYCHEGLSGSPRDTCNDCHATMRPRSHTARFRGPKHGRLAALDSSACASCHEVDYCTECHNVAPNNHFPLSAFLNNHNRRARTNARSCLTCHSFEATCERCHTFNVKPTGGQ